MDVPVSLLNFYHFATLDDCAALHVSLRTQCLRHGLKGTILLAREGINGGLAGSEAGLRALSASLRCDPRLAGMGYQWSSCRGMPFSRMNVKLRPEIVSMGYPTSPDSPTGRQVGAAEWDALLADPEVLVVDVRNAYETHIGGFHAAVAARLGRFRGFPDYVRGHLGTHRRRHIALFCTGGIRCEKASRWMLEQGFPRVSQLQGGILNYLRRTGNRAGHWRGDCFVFDARVAVDTHLAQADYVQCHACRHPLSPVDRCSPRYQPGISCTWCYPRLSAERRARLTQRQRQLCLASRRGQQHLAVLHERMAVRD